MPCEYLFNSDGLVKLAGYVIPGTLFAFDLDGTLAPIVENYSAAKIDEPLRIPLQRLATLAQVAVITGRSRKDGLKMLGFEPQIVIGNHGAEWPDTMPTHNDQYVESSIAWLDQLHEQLNGVEGIEIEFKGESLSLHYRKAMDKEFSLAHINSAIETLVPKPKKVGGKCVVNLLPQDAMTKGDALLAAMKALGAERAVYCGDDETDEEVFSLRNKNIFGLHIGKSTETAAPYYLSSQKEMLGFLNSMVGMLESHSKNSEKQTAPETHK